MIDQWNLGKSTTSTILTRSLTGGLVVAFLVSCAPSLESTHFGPSKLVRKKIERYYAQHASEERGRCTRPYMDAVTRVGVIEDAPERLVVDIRYRYLDRLRDEDPGSDRKVCFGFASRTFTITPVGGNLAVTDMSGTECAGTAFSLNRALGLERRTRTCP